MAKTTRAQATPARFIPPMKALDSGCVPTGAWHCEIKFDGYRAIAVLNNGSVELWSRNHKAMLERFPDVAVRLTRLSCRNAVLDGEVVALDERGRSRFQLLQNRAGGGGDSPVVYYVFDLMHLDGKALLELPLRERRERLAALVGKPNGPVQLSPAFDVEPAELFEVARRSGLEGIIAKRPESRYEPDRRSGAWVKCKVRAEQELVVGGFTKPRRSREHFGAILVGYHQAGRLLYAGKVGTGFNGALLASLHEKFLRLESKACPFANLPLDRRPRFGTGMTAAEMRGVTWLRPILVAQVKFAEWTDEGLLRQPVFLGLRTDKAARQVRREKMTAGGVRARPVPATG